MSSETFVADRTAELGPFLGPLIGGIYDGIRLGAFDTPGDFEAVATRPHRSWKDYFGFVAGRRGRNPNLAERATGARPC